MREDSHCVTPSVFQGTQEQLRIYTRDLLLFDLVFPLLYQLLNLSTIYTHELEDSETLHTRKDY